MRCPRREAAATTIKVVQRAVAKSSFKRYFQVFSSPPPFHWRFLYLLSAAVAVVPSERGGGGVDDDDDDGGGLLVSFFNFSTSSRSFSGSSTASPKPALRSGF